MDGGGEEEEEEEKGEEGGGGGDGATRRGLSTSKTPMSQGSRSGVAVMKHWASVGPLVMTALVRG